MSVKSASTAIDKQPPITFTNDDLRGIIKNHDDPMVIWAIIANADVGRILIDQWSSTDILSYDAFQRWSLRMLIYFPMTPH